jgi:hypothetical protein
MAVRQLGFCALRSDRQPAVDVNWRAQRRDHVDLYRLHCFRVKCDLPRSDIGSTMGAVLLRGQNLLIEFARGLTHLG